MQRHDRAVRVAGSSARMRRFIVLTTLTLGLPAAASAEDIDPDPRFWLEGGIYLPKAETRIGLFEADRSRGTDISLEEDLGFDTDASSVDVTFGAKINNGLFAEASLFAISRNTSVVLDQSIEVEDVTYDVGAAIDSQFDTDIYRLSLGYRFLARDNFELAALLGAHVTDFRFVVEGEGTVGSSTDEVAQRAAIRRGRTVLAPLPVVGLQAKLRPAGWLELRARGDVFDITVGPYDGRLVNLEASATAAMTRNIAAGIAFRSTDYRVRIDQDTYAADLDYVFDGLRLFLRLSI